MWNKIGFKALRVPGVMARQQQIEDMWLRILQKAKHGDFVSLSDTAKKHIKGLKIEEMESKYIPPHAGASFNFSMNKVKHPLGSRSVEDLAHELIHACQRNTLTPIQHFLNRLGFVHCRSRVKANKVLGWFYENKICVTDKEVEQQVKKLKPKAKKMLLEYLDREIQAHGLQVKHVSKYTANIAKEQPRNTSLASRYQRFADQIRAV